MKKLACQAGMVLLAFWLAGCATVGVGASTNHRINAYEKSLREEADWLWNNMNYARTHLRPDPGWCTEEYFEHHPVTLTAAARSSDPQLAGFVDHLNYAADRIGEARQAWDQYCAGRNANPAPMMEAQLRAAYQSLNLIRLAQLPDQPTPAPGSG